MDLQVSISETESVDSLEDQRCVFEIELEKDKSGLGLTVAGYICEKGGNSFILSEQVFFIIVVFFSFAAFQRVFVEFLSRRWWMAVWQTFRGELDQMTRSLRWMGSHSQDIAIRCGKYRPLIGQNQVTGL